jgi:DUF1680 family protein
MTLQRKPIVYCTEWPDQPDDHMRHLLLPDEATLQTEFLSDLLNGVQVIRGQAIAYRVGEDNMTIEKTTQEFRAIPYYA